MSELSLEAFAEVSAELAAGGRLLTVLERHGLSEPRWRSVQSIWLVRLAEEASRQRYKLTDRYQNAFMRHMDRLDKSPPKRDTQPPAANGNSLPFLAPKPAGIPREADLTGLPFQVPAGTFDGAPAAPAPAVEAYAAPRATYPEPQPSYAAPQAAYAQPSYAAPQAAYAQPQPAYAAPQAAYAQPQPAYAAPQAAYAQPQPAYAAPAAGPATAGAYAAPVAASPAAPTMELAHFAALTAEVSVHPHALERARSRYGLDEARHRAVAASWQARFAADPSLYQQYAQLFAHYHAWFAQHGG